MPMGIGIIGEQEVVGRVLVVSLGLPPKRWPHLFPVTSALVASATLRGMVDALAPDSVQWIPVRLDTPSAPAEPYFVMNVIARHACLDRTASEVTAFKKVIVRMKKLVLDESRLPVPRPHLFLLAEKTRIVMVSEELGAPLRTLDGVRVTEANGWGDGHLF
jgi:hypothetical protein